ncbi:hypothetical protein RAS2_36080 [Phycisphaerae bacterium RAS2]|nr:hypothetical protein RAS2_36080 [Phycisphaerae bacterium RAS2]
MAASTGSKTFVIAGAVVALLGGGAWAVAHFSGGAKEAEATPAALPEEYTVEKIKEAAKEDPAVVMDRMRNFMDRTDLTEEQREQARKNMNEARDQMMGQHVDEYFAAKTDDEKNAVLDKHIDEMQKFMKAMEERRRQEEEKEAAEGDDPEKKAEREKRREEMRNRWANRSQAERKTDSETRDPNKSAQRMAYIGAMMRRSAERGIQMPRFGGPGGRGPGGPGGGRRGPGG